MAVITFVGMHPSFRDKQLTLKHPSDTSAQLASDLQRINETRRLADGAVPLVIWLQNAVDLFKGLEQRDTFQQLLDYLNQRIADLANTPEDDHPRWPEELDALLNEYPPPQANDVNPYDVLSVARSEIVDRYAEDNQYPPYIRRDADDDLDERFQSAAQGSRRFILIAGRSRSGKTRMAYEAVQRHLPGHYMLVPIRPGGENHLPEIFQYHEEPAAADALAILWLDDLDRFLDAGQLSVSQINRWLRRHKELVIVATIRLREFDRLNTIKGELGRTARDVLGRAARVQLSDTMSAGEAQRAHEQYPEQVFEGGIGETFVAAHLLKARFDTGAPGSL